MTKFNSFNQIELEDNLKIKWKIKPKLKNIFNKDINNTKLEIEFNKKFIESDITIDLNINGQVSTLKSDKGFKDFNTTISATKKF